MKLCVTSLVAPPPTKLASLMLALCCLLLAPAGPIVQSPACAQSGGDGCVDIARIDYRDNVSGVWYPANSSSYPAYVLKDTRVTLRAVPSWGAFPADKPLWSGTAGATGTGVQTTVTFNTLSTSTNDAKTVTATCGSYVRTVRFIVYELTPDTRPHDNFSGRSQTRFGVNEQADLIYTTQPPGISVSLSWSVPTGPGSNEGTVFTAGAVAGSCTIRATIVGGISRDQTRDITRSITPPTDAYMVQEPGSGIRHTQGVAGVGFLGWIYLEPRDVSFYRIEFREGEGRGFGDGYFAYLEGQIHLVGEWGSVSMGNSVTGCIVPGHDTVDTGDLPAPYSSGRFEWPINWEWRMNGGVVSRVTIATYVQTIDAAGTMTNSKKGAGPFTKMLNDPTTTY